MKKRLALLLCALLMVASTGCVGNFYENAGTINGEDISSGLYLIAQYTAYSEASGMLDESADGQAEVDVLDGEIEGQPAEDWINARTEELLLKYIAVRNIARELEVTLSDEGQEGVEQMMQYWVYMEELYIENGISESTLRRFMSNEYLADQVFQELYSEGGELYVPDEELRAEYEETHAQVRYLMIPLESTVEGVEVSDAVLAATDIMLDDLQNGATMEEVAVEDLSFIYELLQQDFDAENAASTVGTTYFDYTEEENESYSREFLEGLRDMPVGEFGSYVVGTNVLLYEKIETFADDAEFLNMRSSVLNTLKSDEFDEYLQEIYSEYTVEWAFGARSYLSLNNVVTY